jgi:hypothetical protein
MNTPHERGQVFQVQIIWAPKLRLPKQGAKHYDDHNTHHSEVDRQVRGLTHQDLVALMSEEEKKVLEEEGEKFGLGF